MLCPWAKADRATQILLDEFFSVIRLSKLSWVKDTDLYKKKMLHFDVCLKLRAITNFPIEFSRAASLFCSFYFLMQPLFD